MENIKTSQSSAAYGGDKWSPRTRSHREEIGTLWTSCGLTSEWRQLKAVLLHQPGVEHQDIQDPEDAQMLEILDWQLARQQHNVLAQAYMQRGVIVNYVNPDQIPPPNLIFCADLFFMTPEGAILARPASTVRAGEERWIARRITDLGIPIVRTLRGNAIFEASDAAWLNPRTVLIATGLRTNREGVDQVAAVLEEMEVDVIRVGLPHRSMHLMGLLRFLDNDLAIAWPNRVPWDALEALKETGYQVIFIPDEKEATQGGALNFVTLGPREILIASNNPVTQLFLKSKGVICHTVRVSELLKAAGGIGCLTGILHRG
jgi:N-dimethylarginine dimethylaminohydrolase